MESHVLECPETYLTIFGKISIFASMCVTSFVAILAEKSVNRILHFVFICNLE